MPSATSPDPQPISAPTDNLDKLLDNYDKAVDDFLRDLPLDRDTASNTAKPSRPPAEGVDEEIQVRKQRKPIAKLDETRLLSDAGIPKLRRIAKTRVKFRGKGHEFKDLEMLLNTYQLWLDDLYPRAKFRDALAMVEKLGHSKGMQTRRKAWIDSTKPNRAEELERVGEQDDAVISGALLPNIAPGKSGADGEPLADIDQTLREHGYSNMNDERDDHMPDEDELNALMAENEISSGVNVEVLRPLRPGPFDEDEDEQDEDDLDALLAAQPAAESVEPSATSQTRDPKLSPREESFDDEEEVLADMGGVW